MTRAGFILATALFGACVVLGVVAAAPSPEQLGWTTERTCAEWLAEPEAGVFHLTDCEVSLLTVDEIDGRARVQAAGVRAREEQVLVELLWTPDDPALERLASRLQHESYTPDVRRRTTERFADQLVVPLELTGRIDRDDGHSPWVLRPDEPEPFFRAFALVLLGFGLLGLLLLVPAQRRWERRAQELGAQGTRPVKF